MTTSKKNALAVHKGSDFCDELSQRQFGNATKSNKAYITFVNIYAHNIKAPQYT